MQLGEVTSTPEAAVNVGVMVSLTNGSTWTVTDTCYLTGLSIAGDAAVTAPVGYNVTILWDGFETDIVHGDS